MFRTAMISLALSCLALPATAATVVIIDFAPPPMPRPPLPSFNPPILPTPPGPNPGLEVEPKPFDDNVSWFQVVNSTKSSWWDFHFRWLLVKDAIKIYEGSEAPKNLVGDCKGATCGVSFVAPPVAPNESFTVKIPNLSPGDKLFVWATVPEPAGWTLMVAAFGVAGAVVRRRRAVSA